jgi:ABC-type glycerol-3-phosphate transport system substrate-binding protein
MMKLTPRFRAVKPVLSSLLLAFLVAGVPGGCGREQTEKTAEGRTVVRFWQFWTEPKVRAVITRACEEFEAANPDFKVEITDLTWTDGHQKIVAAFAGGAVPDLLELGSDWIAEFADANALMDMTSEYANLNEAYYGWTPAIYQDRCWAIPWYLSTRVLYQNDELVRYSGSNPNNPPVWWGELLQRCKRISQLKGQFYGYGVNAAERHRLYKKFLPYLWSAGGDILSADGSKCDLVSAQAIDALQFIVDLSEFGYIEKQAQLDEMFMSNRLLYHISGDWLYERIKASGSPLKYSAHLMPYPTVGRGAQISFAGGEYLTIPRAATQPLGALKLARYLVNEKNIFNLCIATGCATPASKSVAGNPYFAADSVRQIFMEQLRHSKAPPVHPRWVDIETELEWGVEQALYKKMSVPEALNKTCEKIDKILAEGRKK